MSLKGVTVSVNATNQHYISQTNTSSHSDKSYRACIKKETPADGLSW